MKKITIYHNPRCTKSREALALLQNKNSDLEVVDYLKMPLSETEIKTLLKQLKLNPIDMMRKKEARFSELALSEKSSDAELIKAMAENPILIERPIVTDGKNAIVGRPPENVLKFFIL